MPPNQNRLRDILFFLLVLFYKFNRIVIHVLIELYRNIMVPSIPDNNSAVFISTPSGSTASI